LDLNKVPASDWNTIFPFHVKLKQTVFIFKKIRPDQMSCLNMQTLTDAQYRGNTTVEEES